MSNLPRRHRDTTHDTTVESDEGKVDRLLHLFCRATLFIGACVGSRSRSCSCQGRSISPVGRDIDPEPCRRPLGRRFVLHRTSGPRPQVYRPILCPPRPLERGLLLLLRASTLPFGSLPQPPPPPQPWPPSGVHFHPSDLPCGHSCVVSPLNYVPSVQASGRGSDNRCGSSDGF